MTRRRFRIPAARRRSAPLAAGCGDSKESGSSGQTLRIGYSAWPGWFPLAVAEEKGFFDKAGLKVELTYFVDYTASLDALVAGKVDVNAQTLNDTMLGVAAGSDQRIVVVNDNSTGNDAVICDSKITSVKDLKGKKIAAEAGVVDHFLLLQGLAKEGLKESDIEFSGLKTDAAAAAFAGGQFDCVAVFAPFTVQALERQGSKVLFSSAEFPGVIPDHLVATADAATKRSADMQKLVNAWYATLDYIKANPVDAAHDHGQEGRPVDRRTTRTSRRARRCSPPSRRRRRSPTEPATRVRCPRWRAASIRSSCRRASPRNKPT